MKLVTFRDRNRAERAGALYAEGARIADLAGTWVECGGASLLALKRFLSPGDVVELEIEGIGVLRNRIVKEE